MRGAQRSPGKGDLKAGSQQGRDQHGRDSRRGDLGGHGWSPREELETEADRARRNRWVRLWKEPQELHAFKGWGRGRVGEAGRQP